MKKYITIAALFAAGTIFANAEAEKLTLTSPGGGSLSSSNAQLAWEEAYATLNSWEISFSLSDSAIADADLFGTRKNGGVSQFALRVQSDGSLKLYTYKTGVDSLNNIGLITTSEGVVAANTPTMITLSFIADVDSDSSIVGGTFNLKVGSENLSHTLEERFASIWGNASLQNNVDSRFWTNGGNERFSGITVSRLDSNVIPEPSAFGLISGVGALALVASRRRRK